MTLGLAASKEGGIYLAIESEGLQKIRPHLDSKILELQKNPEIVLLAAGGLDHWCFVRDNYTKQPSLRCAAHEIARLLDNCMTTVNQAFGLVCGFEERLPSCYRINRPKEAKKASVYLEDLTEVQILGNPQQAQTAKTYAIKAIHRGCDILLSIEEAIQKQFPGERIQPPVHVRVMHQSL